MNVQNLEDAIRQIIKTHLPDREIVYIKDRGIWERHNVEVVLDHNSSVIIKIQLSDWNMTEFEATAVRIFREHNLPTPGIIAVDTSLKIIPHPFLIQEWRGGTRLSELIQKNNKSEIEKIYEVLGKFFSTLHSIHNNTSGLLVPFPGAPSPVDYMYQAEITNGSGSQALASGRISKSVYERILKIWAENIDYLKSRQPSLISTSPFLWNIYLEKNVDTWNITKITPMAEFMWWDPAFNLALLKYPPFGQYDSSYWEAFLKGYALPIEEKRLLLYLLMQRLCAAMGVYKAPESAEHRTWADHCLDNIDSILEQAE